MERLKLFGLKIIFPMKIKVNYFYYFKYVYLFIYLILYVNIQNFNIRNPTFSTWMVHTRPIHCWITIWLNILGRNTLDKHDRFLCVETWVKIHFQTKLNNWHNVFFKLNYLGQLCMLPHSIRYTWILANIINKHILM